MPHIRRLGLIFGLLLGACAPGHVGGEDAGAQGDAGDPGGRACSAVLVCPTGQTCVASRCRELACSAAADCPGGLDCVDGRCVAMTCASAADCPAGQDCVAGSCAPGSCTLATDCPAATACVAGACTTVACGTPSECPFEHACVAGFCGASTDPVGPGSDGRRTTPFEGPGLARIVGVVTELDGSFLAGVTVTLDAAGATDTTDASGAYELLDVAPGDHVVHFTEPSYLAAHRGVTADPWETITVHEALMRRAAPIAVDPTTTSTVGGADGSATIPANGLVDASGMPVTGMVDVSVTPVDPTTEEIDGAPGDFVGDQDGMDVPIESYGMVDITVTDDMGDPVDLASGESIEIVIPAPDLPDRPLVVGDTVPTWIYDDTVPGWVRDGVATVEMRGGVLVLVGSVNQTNITWNCDMPEVPVCFTGQVVDCAGYPIPGAEVQLRASGGVTSRTTDRTGTDGMYTVIGTARAGAIIRASLRVGSLSYFVDSDVVTGGAGSCAMVPDLVFTEIRYTSGRVDLTQMQTNIWDGATDISSSMTVGSAFFFDITDPGAGPFVGCGAPPDDTLREVPVGMPGTDPVAEVALLDVGNPIVIDSGASSLDVLRTYFLEGGSLELSSYASLPDVSFSATGGAVYTVDIPGASGVLPQSRLTGALEMPADLAITSPAIGSARSVDSSAGLSLRWTGSASSSLLTLTVIPLSGATTFLIGSLTDDGSFDISPAQLAPFAGSRIQIVLARTRERFEPLATGPSLQLRGVASVSLDVEVR